jgi:hypothetical protein
MDLKKFSAIQNSVNDMNHPSDRQNLLSAEGGLRPKPDCFDIPI